MLIRGAIRFEVNGLNLTRLTDKLVNCGATLYNIHRPHSKKLIFYVNLSDGKKVIAHLENLCYNYSTLENGMLPFAKRLTKRIGLIAGIALFIFCALSSGFFVSEIRISGCNRLQPQAIIQSIHEAGVREGAFGRASCDKISKHVITSHDEVAYAWASYKGVILQVNIVETPPALQILDTTPCDIVSVRTGVISRLLVYQGTPLVKAGDSVNKGDIIIAGYREANGQQYPVKAMGEVYGTTQLTYTYTFYGKRQVQSPTGKTQIVRQIELFGQLFPAERAEAEFLTYTQQIRYAYIFNNNFLPAKLVTTTYYQTETVTITEDFEKVKRIIIAEAEQKAVLKAQKQGKIIETNTVVKDGEDIKYIQTIITVEKSFL